MKIQNILNRISCKTFRVPYEDKLSSAIKVLSKKERKVLFALIIVLVISTIGLLWKINQNFIVEVPARGGSVVEGILGSPRFINPLLTLSDADRDLTALVYSGLMRATSRNTLEPDLAQSYTISEDGLEYTFILKEGLRWHDDAPVTADDVVFTIKSAQNATLKSPRRASWEGVLVEKIDDLTVKFTLDRPYGPFVENTTLGIIPKHKWENVSLEQFTFSAYNKTPIGTGPYKVTAIREDRGGIPEYYDLKSFSKFTMGEPFIEKIRIKFYPTEDALIAALKNGEVENINSISPDSALSLSNKYNIEITSIPRIFGAFFNQNEADIFTDLNIRKALNISVDRSRIINEVMHGYASTADGPIPPGSLGYIEQGSDIPYPEQVKEAKKLLERNGWVFDEEEQVLIKKIKSETNRLSFSVTTSAVPELKNVAQILKENWEGLGANVDIKIFETGDLNQNVIRPRNYDVLLFGEVIGRDADPFAFWHSSQRLDPGLNIALYANIAADKLLEDARKTEDEKIRIEKYQEFQKEISSDIPAVFLYSPDFIYIVSNKLKGLDISPLSIPSERFLNISKWHVYTNKVWKIFLPTLGK